MTLQFPARALTRARVSLARVLDLHSGPGATGLGKVRSFRFGAVLQGIVLASAAFATLGAAALATDVDAATVCAAPGRDTIPTSGIVNSYWGGASATNGGTNATVTLGNQRTGTSNTPFGTSAIPSTGISAGDLLIIMQTQGPNSGTYEYVTAVSPAGPSTSGAITVRGTGSNGNLVYAYTQSYSNGSTFQVIRVPQTLTAALGNYTAAAWDVDASGYGTGGVFALDVAQQATLNGTINVQGQGFRGGAAFNLTGETNGLTSSSTAYPAGDKTGGSKGEGTLGTPGYVFDGYGTTIKQYGPAGLTSAAFSTALGTAPSGTNDNGSYVSGGGSFGFGSVGNAGGGGNDALPGAGGTNQYNSGGAGGGSAGRGGQGGWTWLGTAAYCQNVGYTPTQCPFVTNEGITDAGGRGGSAIGGLSAGVVVLGGGGGAASVNNNTKDVDSITSYPPIDVAVDPVSLSGGSTTVSNGADGAISGSGARGGGIVLIRAGTFNAGAGQILADGIRAYNQFGTSASEAAGGGGGGGAIVVLAQAASGTLQTSALGGRGGDPDYYAHGPGGGGGGGYVLTNFSVTGSVSEGGGGYVPNINTAPNFTLPNHYGTDAVPGIQGYLSSAGGTTPGTSSGAACSPDVAATVTLPTADAVGATVNGSFNYVNNGPSDSVGAGYGATLSAGLGTVTFGTITLNGVAVAGATATYNNSTGSITYTGLPGTLPNGQTLVVPISFIMPANGTSVTGTDIVSEAATDPVPSNNNGTATVNGTPQADDAVTITGLPANAAPSAAIFGVLNFVNNGPSVSNNVTYTAKLPVGAAVSSIKYNGTTLTGASATVGADGTVTFTGLPTTLNVNDTVTVAFNATMPASGGSATSTATIAAGTTDPNTSNNTATAIVAGQGTADLATTITGVPTSAQAAGSTFTGSVNFQNNGPSTASTPVYTVQVPPGSTISASQVLYNGTPINGVTVTIDQYGNVTFGGTGLPTSLANGDKITIGFNATMPADGSNANVVSSISSPTTDPVTSNNNATATVTGIREADLQSTVTGYATYAQTAGTSETGTITFANNGPSSASGVTYTSTVSGSPTSVTLGTPMLNGVAISGATATYNAGTGAVTYTGLPTNLNSGDKITVAVTFPMPGNPVTVSSNISSNTTDPNPSNNAGSQTLNGGNDLSVTLTNWPTTAQTSGTAETSTATFAILNGSQVAPANYTPVLNLTPGLTGVTITATNGVTATYNATTGAVSFTGLPTLATSGTGTSPNFVLTIKYTMPTTNVVASASISESPNIDTYSGNNSATATVPGGAAMTDMATTITGLGGVAAAGSTVSTGVINFTNAATNISTGDSFAAKLPVGATVTSILLNGAVITGATATVGSDGTVTFSGMPTTLAKSAVVAVAFSFPMPSNGSAATATATITSTNDSNAANNTATATETGDAPTDLQTIVNQPTSGAANSTLNGTVQYLNNGPSNAVNPTYGLTLPVAGGTPTITSVMLNGSLLSVTTSISPSGVVTFTGMPTTLSSGDNLVVAYTYKTPSSGSVSTTSQISYPGTDTVPGNNSATGTTTVTANAPTVMVTKTVDHTTHNAGDSVNWTLTVTNTGNSVTTGVITLTDTLPAGITNVVITPSSGTTCSPSNPSAGTTLTCSVPAGLAASGGVATVGIAATLPSAGTYDNSVTPSGNSADNPTCAANACSTVTVVGSATMQVFKTSVHGTGTFGYQLTNMSATTDSITTTNQSTSTPGVINVVTSLSTAITVAETFPTGYSITSASCVDTNAANDGNVTTSFGTLAGSTLTIPTADIKQNATLQCTFVNTITDTISIAKTGPTAMTVGNAANYTLTLTNTSTTQTVTTATVSDQLPAGFTFNSGSGNGWTCSAVGQLVTCNFAGTLASAGKSVIVLSVTPSATATGVINYATVDPSGGTAPAAPAGCTASTTCALSPAANVTGTGLSIAKSAPTPGLMPNANSVYTLTVTNNGTAAATAANIRDQLPTQLTYVSATGTGWACTENTTTLLISCVYAGSIAVNGTSTIAVTVKPTTQAVVGTSVTNYASIDPTGGNAPPTAGSSCTPATSCASQTSTVGGPNVQVTKTVDQATHAQGDTITWTIKAANTGGSATAGVITLTDSLPNGITNIVATPSSGVTCSANPTAGGTLTCSVPAGLAATSGVATVTITATASTTGTITNSVTPSGTDNPTCASGACSASTMVGGQSLTLQKALTGPRVVSTDQFTVQISAAGTVVASATTTGSGNTVANGSTGATAVIAGTAYTLGEVAAGTTTLTSYTSALACTNATTGSATTLPTTVGGSVTPAAGDRITCTITNSAQPLVTLTKALGTARVKDTDEFTIEILQGATTTASATTTGSGSSLGSNTTGAVQVTAGTTYTLNEIAAVGSGTSLAAYNSSLACVNSTSGSTTVLPTVLGGSLTPANGDNITCTLTNGAAPVLVTSITGLPASAEPAASVSGVLNYSNTGGVTATGVVYSATLPTGLTGVVLGTPAINGAAVSGATATYNSTTGAITFAGMPATQAAGAAGAVTVALTFTMPAANVTVTTRETSTNAATVNGTASVTEVPQTTLTTAPSGLPGAPTAPGATVNGSLTFNNTGANPALNTAYSATLPTGLTGVVLGTPTVNGVAVTGATATYNTGTGAITITGLPATQPAGATGNVAVPLQFVMPTSGASVAATTQETADNAPTANGTATVAGETLTALSTAPTGLPTAAQAPGTTENGSLTFNNTGTSIAYNPAYSATLPTGLTGVVLGTPTVNGAAVTGATATYNSSTGAISITGLPATQAAGAVGNVAVPLQFVMPAAGTNVVVTTQETANNATTANGTATVTGETTTLAATPAGLPTTPQAPGATVTGSLTFDNTGTSIAANPGYAATLPTGLTGVVLGTPTLNGVAVTGATATYNSGTGAITISGLPATQAAGATGNVAVPLQFVMPTNGSNVLVTTTETASNATTATGQATVTGEALTTITTAPIGLPTTAQAPGTTENGSLTFNNTGATTAYNPVYSGTLPTGLTGVVLGTPTVNGVPVTGATGTYNAGTGAITITGLPTTQAAGATGNVAVPLQFVMPAAGGNVVVTTQETASNATTASGTATVTGETTTLTATPAGLPTTPQAVGTTVNGSLTFDNTGTNVAANPGYAATLPTGLTGVVLGTPTVNGVAVTGATATYNSATGAITISGLPATQPAGATGNVAVTLQFVMPTGGANVLVTTTETASNAPTATGQTTVSGEVPTTLTTAPAGLPTTAQAPGTTENGSLTFNNTGTAIAYNPVYGATLPTGLTGVVLGTPTVNGVAVTGATATYNSGSGAITIAGLPATQAAGATGNVAVPLQFVMPASGANVLVTTTESASNAPTATGQVTVDGEAMTTLTTAPTGLPTTAQAPGTAENGSLTFDNTGATTAFNPVYSGTLPAGLTGVVLGTPTVNGVAVTGATATYNTGTGAITIAGLPATQAAGATGNVAVPLQFVMPAAGGNVAVHTTESASNATTANGMVTVTGEATTLAATPAGLPTATQAPGATVNGSLTFDNTGANVAANPAYAATLPTGLTGVVLGTPTVNGVAVTGATATYNSGTGAITIAGLPATQAAGATGNVAVPLQFVMPASGANVLVTTTETASNAPTATGQVTVNGEALTTLTTAPTGLPTAAQIPGATVNGSLTFNNTGANTAYNPVYGGTLPTGLTGVVLGTPTVNGVAVTGATATYNSGTGAITLSGMPTTQAAGATGNVAVPLQFVMPAAGGNVVVNTSESASNAPTATGTATVAGEALTTLSATPTGLPTTQQAPGATVTGALSFSNTGASTAYNPVFTGTLPTGLTGVVLGTPTLNGVAVTGATATYSSGTGAITLTGMPATQAAGAAGNVGVSLQFVMPASGANVLVSATESASNAPTATGNATVNGETLTTLAATPAGLPTTQQAPGATVNGSLTFDNTGASAAFAPVYSGTLPTGLTGVVLGTPTVNGVAVTGATATYNTATGTITITGLPATQPAGATGNVAVPLQFAMPASGASVIVHATESASNAATATGQSTVTGETLTTLAAVPSGLPTTAQAPAATINGSLTFDNTGVSTAFNPVYSASLPANLTGVVLGTPTVNGVAVTGATATYTPGTGVITISGLPATQAAGATGNVAVPLQFAMPTNGANVVVNTTESASNATTATGQATVTGEALTTLAASTTGLPTTQQAPGATVNGTLTFSNTGTSTAFSPVYGGTLPTGLTGVVLGQPSVNGVPVTGATATYNPATGVITLAGMPATQAAGAAGTVTVPLQFVMPVNGSNVVVNSSESASNAPTATGQSTVNGESLTTLTTAPSGLPSTTQAPGATVNGSLTFNNTGAATAFNPVYSATLPANLTGVVLGTPTVNGVAVTGATATYTAGTGAITISGLPATQPAGAAGNVAVPLQFAMPTSGNNVLVNTTESASNATTATGTATVNGEALTTLSTTTTGLPTTQQAPGSTETGSLTFGNTGASTAYNPIYSGTLPTGLTGVVLGTPTLNGVAVTGATATYNPTTGAVTISGMPATQAAGAAGNVAVPLQFTMPNGGASVTVATQETANNAPTATGSVVVAGVPQATLSATVTGFPTTVQQPNAPVSGFINFTNTGANTATNPVYSGTLPPGLAGVTFGTPTLNGVPIAGATATYNPTTGAITFTGTPTTLAPGAVLSAPLNFTMPASGTNVVVTAQVTASNAPTANGTGTVPGNATADLAIQTSAPATVAPDGSLVYTLTITNNGPSSANNATFSDPLPAVLGVPTASCASNSAGVTCGPTVVNGKTVTGTITSLPAGGSAIITITTTAPASGSVTNTATVAAPAGITDPVPGNNTSSATTTVGAVGNNVDLSVTTSGTTTVQVNGAVTYVVDVVNGGPAAANNAVFNYTTAAVVTGVTWTCQAVGGGAICPAASGNGNTINQTIATFPDGGHLVYTIHGAAPANAQQYVDTATITAPAGTVETNPANNTASTTTNVQTVATPSADVAVTINGPTTVQPSAPVVYTVVVSNNGPASGNGTTLSAPVPTVVTNVTTTCTATGGAVCPTVAAGNNVNTVIPTLPVGGELTFTVTGTAPTSGTFSESATVTPPTGTNDPVPSNNTAGPVVTTVPVLSADLSIQKNGPAQVVAGGIINYTIIVSNAGPNAGDGASVTDVLPAALTNASVVCSAATGGAACGTAAITGGTLHAVAGALPAAGSITLTVSGTAPASGTLSNSASVAPPTGVTDPNMGNNTAGPVQTTIVASVPTQADLSATISGPSIVAPNGTVTYVVTITNAGPAAGNGAPISDVLPSVLTNISAVCGNTVGGATCGAVAVNGKTVSSIIGALPVGASLTLTITATAPASGTFSNSASVGAAPGETDPNTANNVAGPVVTTIGVATGTANLGISKTGPDMAGAGSTFSYTLLVSNAGPGAANGAVVSDAVPTGLTNIHATCSAPTNGAVCGPVTVAGQNVTSAVQSLPALGTVTITVTVTAPVPSGLQPTTVVNRATVTPPAGINDPDTSDNVSNAVETAIVSAGVSGTVWLDINHDKKLDAGDPLLPNWIVELFHNGVLVATTTTNAQGQYSFSGVPPGPGYSIDFRDPGSKAVYGTPTNGNEGVPNPDSNAVIGNGVIQSLTLKPGINIVQQSLPVDPSGVVYDATVRTPVGGATVTLIGPAGFNPATELVGGTGNATQITESSGATAGAYQFLLINPGQPGGAPTGTYTIVVTPPAGYLPTPAKAGGVSQPGSSFTVPGPISATTAIQPQEGPPKVGDNGPGTIYYFNLVFNNGSGAVINNNVPLDRISGGALTVQKTGSTATADIGETVLYTVDVTSSVGLLPNVTLTDRLPRGFTLIPGTTTINGVKAADPKSNNDGVLSFLLGSIAASVTDEIKYRVRIGVGAQQGDGINRAQASNPLGATSNVATFKVDVNGGVFTTNACVVGKVFIDCNGNLIQDDNEIGIPGVRLYFSDGTFVVTDSEGKYSYCGLRPTTHTLKVDKTTLPPGSRLVESSNRNALDPNSLFIDLKNGELHEADFIEGSCSPQVMEETKARRGQGEVNAAQPDQKVAAPALIFDSKPLNMSTPAARPAAGASTPGAAQ